MKLQETQVLETTCPHCGLNHNRITGMEAPLPDPGDVTLCMQCGEWSVYGNEKSLEKPSDEMLAEIAENKTAQRVRAAWVLMQKNMRRY
jgi:hypothetical protein